MKASEDYARDAMLAIDKYGWIRHGLGTPQHGFCVLGAIRHVCKGSDSVYVTAKTLAVVWQRIRELDLDAPYVLSDEVSSLVVACWNDRVADEVDIAQLVASFKDQPVGVSVESAHDYYVS